MSDPRISTIEDGIPVPGRQRVRADPRPEAMKAGQSVFFTNFDEAKSLFGSMRWHFKKNNQPFVPAMRKVEGGWRVWKVSK